MPYQHCNSLLLRHPSQDYFQNPMYKIECLEYFQTHVFDIWLSLSDFPEIEVLQRLYQAQIV